MTASRELAALIAERGEAPELVGANDDAELYRFADNTEVAVTNAGLVTEDAEGWAELRAQVLGTFASILRWRREAAGLSVAELATAAGLHRETVRLYENGERRPTWDAVQALASALGASTDVFRDKGPT